MMTTAESTSEPPAAWPVLVTQAGKHGNREVMLPAKLGRTLQKAITGALMSPEEEHQGLKSVRVDAYLVLSRRIRPTSDRTAHVWDGRSWRPLAGHVGIVGGVSLSHDGRVAATAGWDHTLRTWDTRTGATVALIAEERHQFSGCCLDRDGRMVAVTGFDGTVGVYNARSGKASAHAELKVNLPGAVTFDGAGRAVYAGAQDGTIRRVGGKARSLAGHEGPVTALALSPNGRTLASTGRDGAAVVWNLATARELVRLPGHPSGATACAYLDSAHLLTGGWDGVVHRWNLRDGTRTTVWEGASAVRALAVVDGKAAISSQDGVLTLLDLAGEAEPAVLSTGAGHLDTIAAAAKAPVLISGSANDVPDAAPAVRDGFGRPATFTEGLVIPADSFVGEVPPSVWDRVHAESLTAMAIAASDPTGRTVVAAPRIPWPPAA